MHNTQTIKQRVEEHIAYAIATWQVPSHLYTKPQPRSNRIAEHYEEHIRKSLDHIASSLLFGDSTWREYAVTPPVSTDPIRVASLPPEDPTRVLLRESVNWVYVNDIPFASPIKSLIEDRCRSFAHTYGLSDTATTILISNATISLEKHEPLTPHGTSWEQILVGVLFIEKYRINIWVPEIFANRHYTKMEFSTRDIHHNATLRIPYSEWSEVDESCTIAERFYSTIERFKEKYELPEDVLPQVMDHIFLGDWDFRYPKLFQGTAILEQFSRGGSCIYLGIPRWLYALLEQRRVS